jgi:hypothetical protein
VPPQSVPISLLLGFFIQIDRGVTRDPFFKFDISTLANIWCDTPKIFDKSHGNSRFFLRFSGDFGCAVTSRKFDEECRDPRPQPKFDINRGVRDL